MLMNHSGNWTQNPTFPSILAWGTNEYIFWLCIIGHLHQLHFEKTEGTLTLDLTTFHKIWGQNERTEALGSANAEEIGNESVQK